MEDFICFYVLATGEIISGGWYLQADADAAILADPTLGYVIAPGEIAIADYYVVGGVLTAKPPVPEYFCCFYKLADVTGTITFGGWYTLAEADVLAAADPTVGYIAANAEIVIANYYIAAGPTLTPKPGFEPDPDPEPDPRYYFVFWVTNDPDGEIIYANWMTQAQADAQLVTDPALSYLISPDPIQPSEGHVENGVLVWHTPTPPVVLKYYAFYETDDPLGTFLQVLNCTEAEANLHLTNNPDLSKIEVNSMIKTGDHFYAQGGGQSGDPLAVKEPVPYTLTGTTVVDGVHTLTADGVATATISGLEEGTKVTLLATVDFPEVSEVIPDDGTSLGVGSTTLKTEHKIPHILRLELDLCLPTEITIHGV